MTSQLKVDVIGNNKSKNSFGNSFAFSDDLVSQNEFIFHAPKDQKKNTRDIVNTQANDMNSKHPTEAKKDQKHDDYFFTPKKQKQNKNKPKISSTKEPNQIFRIEELKKNQHNTNIVNKSKQQPQIKSNRKQNNQKNYNQTIQIQEDIPISKKTYQKPYNKANEDIPEDQDQQKPQKVVKRSKQQKTNPFQNQTLVQQQSPKSKQTPSKAHQKFQTKVTSINQNIHKLNNNLKNIKDDYLQIDKLAQDELLFKRHDKRKQMQIRDFLTQKRLQKEKRHKKIQEIRNKQEEIVSKTIQQTEVMKQQQRQQKIKRIRDKDYLQPKQRQQRYHQSQQTGKKLAEQLAIRYKDPQPFHQRKQRQYEQLLKKQKYQQQQILMQRKQRYQSLDLEELEEHRREYEEKRQELQTIKKQYREQQWNKIQQDNSLMHDQIWKGPSHDLVDEELLEMKRKKQQPKEKVKKMKNYYQHIKNNFLPKTHQPKRSPIHNQHISQSLGNYAGMYHVAESDQLASYDPHKKHVKRYKFFQGKAVGEVVESVIVARSYSEQKKIGQSYLEYLKQLPKKQAHSETQQIDLVDLEMISRKFNAITRVKKESMPFYEQSSQKRTVSLSLKPTKQEVKMVYEQLKNHDVKLQSKRQLLRAMKQNSPDTLDLEKDVNTNLVLNMERKLDLLSKL